MTIYYNGIDIGTRRVDFFVEENLDNILNDLSRFYDVRIDLNSEVLGDKLFTASFKEGIICAFNILEGVLLLPFFKSFKR